MNAHTLSQLLLDAAGKSFWLAGAALLVMLAVRRGAPALRHFIWLLVMAGLLLLPAAALVAPFHSARAWAGRGNFVEDWVARAELNQPPDIPAVASGTVAAPSAHSADATSPGSHPAATAAAATAAPRELDARHCIVWAWMAGLAATLLAFAVRLRRLRGIERACKMIDSAEFSSLVETARRELNLKRRVRFLQSAQPLMPMTWGWWRPVVLLPPDISGWERDRLQSVLRHELGHVKRWDCLTQGFANLVCALFWFNPLVWLAARLMRRERERACDDLVLSTGLRPSEYAAHLLEIARHFARAPHAAAIPIARRSGLESRLRFIMDSSRKPGRLRPAAACAAGLIVGALFLGVGGCKTGAPSKAASAKESVEGGADFADFPQVVTSQAVSAKESVKGDTQNQTARDGVNDILKILNEFGDTGTSRDQLLSELQAYLTDYPDSQYRARAADMAAELIKMREEARIHDTTPRPPWDQLAVDQQVSELIYRLRDQNGRQMGSYSFNLYWTRDGSTNTPAHLLRRIGYPAVPQLIAAIGDPTLSRTVGYYRQFVFSHNVLTVGDCAVDILNDIAGKRFCVGYLSRDTNTTAVEKVRQDVKAWWSAIQTKGEKQVLIEAAEAGDDYGQAQMLWEKYPDVAPDALIRGVKASAHYWYRDFLIQILAGTNTPAVNELLDDEMRHDTNNDCRISAAKALYEHGRNDIAAFIIPDWQTNAASEPDAPWTTPMLRLLAGINSPDAIAALASDLDSRTVFRRQAILGAIGEAGTSGDLRGGTPSADTKLAIERVLVTALSDYADEQTSLWNPDGTTYNPRVADEAGYYLNHIWPARYRFDPSGTLKTRDRQIIECQNVWRKNNGLPALPIPVDNRPPLAEADANQVTAINWAKDGIQPQPALAAQFDALKGKPLAIEPIVKIVRGYEMEPIAGTCRLETRIRRDEDLKGVTISLRLLAGNAQTTNAHWTEYQTGAIGTQRLGSGGQGFDPQLYQAHPERYVGALTMAVMEATAAPPTTPYYLIFDATLNKR
jgi:beta-lactamase regulating signal transducer with metallopeptidase domain